MSNLLPYWHERIAHIEKIRPLLLNIAESHGTPRFIFDGDQSRLNIRRFRSAFDQYGLNPSIYFAIKSNPYPGQLKTVVQAGAFLDASSRDELKLSLQAGSPKILFTGPGKTREDILALLELKERAFNHIDSFSELEMIGEILLREGSSLNCGIRVHVPENGRWSKFGIPLSDLPEFFQKASRYKGLSLHGIQFHQSMNESPEKYTNTLRKILDVTSSLSVSERGEIRVVDIGGGFPSPSFEGSYPWNEDEELLFDNSEELEKILRDEYQPRYVAQDVVPIDEFAKTIAQFWKEDVLPVLPRAELWTEPGSYLAHSVLHILLRVVDVKANRTIILDGGTNMVGYERYQYIWYVPTFNLTRFSKTQEEPCLLYGSLCTPNDLWSHYLYGKTVEKGDVIVIPFQGDYTYTYSQPNFIRGLQPVVDL